MLTVATVEKWNYVFAEAVEAGKPFNKGWTHPFLDTVTVATPWVLIADPSVNDVISVDEVRTTLKTDGNRSYRIYMHNRGPARIDQYTISLTVIT